MRKTGIFFSLLLLAALSFQMAGCKKSSFTTDGHLSFSTDTLVFDTIFTTIGSTTHQFKIYNNNTKLLKIDEIELMGGTSSPFRINIDGYSGTSMSDIEIKSKDSLFAFVDVNLAVNGQNLPLVVEDSIRFRTNGVDQYVHLAVWGQDMYYHYSNTSSGIYDLNEGTWPNDKPHVIYGAAFVDSAKSLTIQAGTKIYMHKSSILYVYKGKLDIQGALNNEVVIQGDRMEQDYADVNGQYYGIYFHQAQPSTIDYAIIKNGTAGIHMYSRDQNFSQYTLTLTNSKIYNHARYGVFLYAGAKLKAENCLIAKNQNHALLVLQGSDFHFNHCDLLGYGSGTSSTPAVGISNYYNDYTTSTTYVSAINEGVIYNSVIYGNMYTELVFDTISDPDMHFDIQNCLIKRETAATESYFQNIYWSTDDAPLTPGFENVSQYKFNFFSGSPLIGTASSSFTTLFSTDIQGLLRNSPPDIGAIRYN